MISHEHRCIFVHIPRTGGTSIEDVIWPGERTVQDLWMGFIGPYHNKYRTGGLQHLFASDIREEVGERTFGSYFKFAFVRNPWDKAVSQYLLTSRRPDLRQHLGMSEGDSFARYLKLISGRDHVQWEAQYRFIFSDDGKPLVDFVGRFEHLLSDAEDVFRRIGIKARLPHRHASRRLPIEHYYDAESVAIVAELYKQDIDVFEYSFPGPLPGP